MTNIFAILNDGNDVNMPALRSYLASIEAQIVSVGAGVLGSAIVPFATVLLRDADTTRDDGTLAYVYANNSSTSDPLNGFSQWDDANSQWVAADWIAPDVSATVKGQIDLTIDGLFVETGKNLINKAKFRRGSYYSPGANEVVASALYVCTDFIPVQPGEEYTFSGAENAMVVAAFETAADDGPATNLGSASPTRTYTIPADHYFLVCNITNNGESVTDFDDTAQLESGSQATSFEEFVSFLPVAKIKDGETIPMMIDEVQKNKIDVTKIDFVNRYSTGSKTFTVDTLGIAASGYIPVVEGAFYTVSGDGLYGSPNSQQGGFFSGENESAALSNIAFGSPPSGDGKVFQVPVGLSITHAVISLRKAGDLPASTTLDGNVQLESGEVATDYEAFEVRKVVPTSNLPNDFQVPSGIGNVTTQLNDAAWFKYTEGEPQPLNAKVFTDFRAHWIARDKDLVIVNTGTSLTARSIEHCTAKSDAKNRPPLMHSNNFASIFWDHIRWDGQSYHRYDDSAFVTEIAGSFSTVHDLAEWDDGLYRNGLTRYSETTGAQVSLAVDASAWAFNFIYRTDTVATENVAVAVAEGNAKMQVFDDVTDSWVEANGYVFSMREDAPVPRDIDVPSPGDDTFSSLNIASKGNTTYQKRLKFRCKGDAVDSIGEGKTISFSGQTAGRFNYWGFEWSPREFMLTYINAARGSHNTQATGATGLPRYQDNEIWGFEPDLLFFELPIHNDGAAAAGSYAENYWQRLTNNFVFRADYELSLKTRGASFGLAPEIGMFTSSIAFNFNGINDDGTLKFGEQLDGRMMTPLEKFDQAYEWVKVNHPEAVAINAARRWVEAGFSIFGDMKTATLGSGPSGLTFTNEGSHWNDTGSKIIAKAVIGAFDFTH